MFVNFEVTIYTSVMLMHLKHGMQFWYVYHVCICIFSHSCLEVYCCFAYCKHLWSLRHRKFVLLSIYCFTITLYQIEKVLAVLQNVLSHSFKVFIYLFIYLLLSSPLLLLFYYYYYYYYYDDKHHHHYYFVFVVVLHTTTFYQEPVACICLSSDTSHFRQVLWSAKRT